MKPFVFQTSSDVEKRHKTLVSWLWSHSSTNKNYHFVFHSSMVVEKQPVHCCLSHSDLYCSLQEWPFFIISLKLKREPQWKTSGFQVQPAPVSRYQKTIAERHKFQEKVRLEAIEEAKYVDWVVVVVPIIAKRSDVGHIWPCGIGLVFMFSWCHTGPCRP